MLDARLRFDSFVVGSANRLAAAAARAVAESPGTIYNPLFIYSGSGLGKTHLACAIGNQVKQSNTEASVIYTSLDDVVAELHGAVARGDVEGMRHRYLSANVLLIDDIQFLAGRRETQTEVLRLLNALQGAGTQVVLTSDRPPAELGDVDDRLITRLAGGLIVDIGIPDFETRTAILRTRCDERGVRFRSGVIEELGGLSFANVRELQGALTRLIAVQTLGGEPVAPDDVARVLGDLAPARNGRNGAQSNGSGPRRPQANEFQNFLDEVTSAVSEHVDAWQPPIAAPSTALGRQTFEVGESNQLAARAADTIVETPAVKYNPLFLHGPSGVGKTHLMNAIGIGLLHGREPSSGAVACVPAQTFVDELIAALQDGTVDRWRARYCRVEALLLDDVQFLAGKERTQEELFHVFNALASGGRQLVFASDRPPGELAKLEDRLRSRFEGGLVVAMGAPDRPLRERIYARLFRERGHDADAEMVAAIAERPAANVREMIGVVNALMAAAEVAGARPTLGLARQELDLRASGSGKRALPRVSAEMDTLFLDLEKVIWEWPDVSARMIEELR